MSPSTETQMPGFHGITPPDPSEAHWPPARTPVAGPPVISRGQRLRPALATLLLHVAAGLLVATQWAQVPPPSPHLPVPARLVSLQFLPPPAVIPPAPAARIEPPPPAPPPLRADPPPAPAKPPIATSPKTTPEQRKTPARKPESKPRDSHREPDPVPRVEEEETREQARRDAEAQAAQDQLRRQQEAEFAAQAAREQLLRQEAERLAMAQAAEALAISQYQPLHKPTPDYPRRALEQGLEGDCTVEYTVTVEGRVSNPRLVDGGCDDPLFARPSLASASRFRYQPRLVDGRPVAVEGVRNTFRYRIER